MLNYLNELLSKLPFNGKKTAFGVIVSLLVYLYPDFPKDDLQKFIDAVVEIIGLIANAYLLIGPLHKWIKSKV